MHLDFAHLFDHAPCGYLVLNPDGKIDHCNKTFCEWVGRDITELKGVWFPDLLNVSGRIFYETHFAPLMTMQGFFNEVALDFVAKDGSKISTLANARQERDDYGKVTRTLLTIFQATDRRRHERELDEARKQAEADRREIEKLASSLAETGLLRDEFIAVLGHDLRNPLASIDSGVRLLRKEQLSESGQKIIGLIQGSVTRMSALIENVMDLTRGRLGGGIAVNRDATDSLEPVLRQVITEIETASGKKIEANLVIPVVINADRTRIGQLASNLISNAVSHGAPEKPVRVSSHIAGNEFVLSVANDGEPIPPEIREKLFQPFFRGHANSNTDGLGLGLHIASEIAKAHGGSLSVTSTSKETEFTFRMPVITEEN